MPELAFPVAVPAFHFDAETVVRSRASTDMTCYWCRKLLSACNGQRGLGEVADLLHLPLGVCIKLAQKALSRGWLEVLPRTMTRPNAAPSPCWQELEHLLGPGNAPLLSRAASMNRCPERQIPTHEVGNFLIAVELLLPETERHQMLPRLDSLRQRYAS